MMFNLSGLLYHFKVHIHAFLATKWTKLKVPSNNSCLYLITLENALYVTEGRWKHRDWENRLQQEIKMRPSVHTNSLHYWRQSKADKHQAGLCRIFSPALLTSSMMYLFFFVVIMMYLFVTFKWSFPLGLFLKSIFINSCLEHFPHLFH